MIRTLSDCEDSTAFERTALATLFPVIEIRSDDAGWDPQKGINLQAPMLHPGEERRQEFSVSSTAAA